MGHTYTRLIYHIIYSTKNRELWLVDEIKNRIFAYKAGIIKNHKGKAIIINGTAEHLHILCELQSSISIADLVLTVKANSSSWFHKTFKRAAFAWQEGYAALTVSPSKIEIVKKYIQNQEENHRKITFKEEYLSFLKEEGIKYDKRYVFD